MTRRLVSFTFVPLTLSLVQSLDIGWILKLAAMAAISSCLLTFPAKWLGRRLDILDFPGHRSSHQNPTPRTGGLAIFFSILLCLAAMLCLAQPRPPAVVVLELAGLTFVLAALGFLDDIFSLPPSARFMVQMVVAAAAAWLFGGTRLFGAGGSGELLFWPAWAFSTLFIVAFVNFFNFMDGINGIAAFQGIIGAGAICLYVLVLGGNVLTAALAAVLAGACLGFLPHNFPKAGIFMGDGGSMVLGFLLALLGLKAAGESDLPWIGLVMPLGIFIYDPVFTLVKRLTRHENVVQAHREHHYQLLVRSGWSHASVTLLQGLLMILCSAGGAAYMVGGIEVRLAVIGGLLVTAVVYSILVHRHFARKTAASGSRPQASGAAADAE